MQIINKITRLELNLRILVILGPCSPKKQIFPEKITFDGEKFGTKELSLIYKMNQQTSADKSNLVTPRRIELRFPG